MECNLAALAAERGKEERFRPLAGELAEMFATIESPLDYHVLDVLFHRRPHGDFSGTRSRYNAPVSSAPLHPDVAFSVYNKAVAQNLRLVDLDFMK